MGDICESKLPPEAHETLDLIEQGGPFPYPQDGTVFQNREGILPDQPDGYYHEYTVETPGSDDRGARRIVTGEKQQEDYYTADHYASFDLVDYTC
ncbi:ribonuclease [Streptomyces albus]